LQRILLILVLYDGNVEEVGLALALQRFAENKTCWREGPDRGVVGIWLDVVNDDLEGSCHS